MAVSSSSSTPTPAKQYDVFLSFRGEDTRDKFTSHLHAKLVQKNIDTYIDYRLKKGDKLSEELPIAIRGSKISVIILSKNYASSSWCLDEVACILKCKKVVVPVFYDVEPTEVRKQLDDDQPAYKKHMEKGRADKVVEWKAALTEVAGRSGWDSQNYNGTEAEFVEAIVKDILEKLIATYPSSDEFKDLVGIEERFKKMDQLLCIDNSQTVRFIGIWGMGGLGKTTLARVVFLRLSSNFLGRCFLENVGGKSEKREGLESLKKELFSKLLEEDGLESITWFHRKRLGQKKVLVVLDDVDEPEQLEDLAADHERFGPGSRIIVTTRDAQVLRNRADETYEITGLAFDDALQLFKLKAFKRNSSPTTHDDDMLLERAVKHADGNPLALTVLASFLRMKRKENWEIELQKLKESPHQRVHNILKISFDGLNEREQDIFLDIACLFSNEYLPCRKCVERMLGAQYLPDEYVTTEIDSLVDKSLITVKGNNTLLIHDLLKEMGWKIEAVKEPGKRSRFWQEKHLYDVIKHNMGILSAVDQGIYCFRIGRERDWSPTMFNGMQRLWFLHMYSSHLDFPQGLQYLPDTLKCLIWPSWPWKSLPSNFMARYLVEIRMPLSKLEQLWSDGVQQNLGNLKYVDLRGSRNLIDISALSRAPNLVSINLAHCNNLRHVPPLRFRNVRDNLTSLDQSSHECVLSKCQTPGQLKLEFCENLKFFSEISENLEYLNLSHCHSLKSLPSDVQKMKSLKCIDLNQCYSFDKLPAALPTNLIQLKLTHTSIEHVPPSITNLSKLRILEISFCERLKSLPELPLSLEFLHAGRCISLETISNSGDALIQRLRSGNHVMALRLFHYAGCLKLDQNTLNNILTEFQLRTLHMSINSVLPIGGSNESESDYTGVGISFPGNKIPMWFTYQSESSSINVKLPCDWQNTNFRGFVLCVVIREAWIPFELLCKAIFTSNNAKSCKLNCFSNHLKSLVGPQMALKGSDLFMWYKHRNYHEYHDAVEVSFHFHTKICVVGRVHVKDVSACGVRLLYRQDVEELGITNELRISNA